MPVDRRRYGRAHRAARAAYVAVYQPGVTPCALCGRVMDEAPSRLDLAHDESGLLYRGLAHRRCNRDWGQAETNRRMVRDAGDPEPRPRTNW